MHHIEIEAPQSGSEKHSYRRGLKLHMCLVQSISIALYYTLYCTNPLQLKVNITQIDSKGKGKGAGFKS